MNNKGRTEEANRHEHIPSSAQWLGGQGEGCWFYIERSEKENEFIVKRYSLSGNLDCERIFYGQKSFNIEKDFSIIHPSHCAKINIRQGDEIIELKYIEKINKLDLS